jgi:type IV secretory pathway VirD2 relaxase
MAVIPSAYFLLIFPAPLETRGVLSNYFSAPQFFPHLEIENYLFTNKVIRKAERNLKLRKGENIKQKDKKRRKAK